MIKRLFRKQNRAVVFVDYEYWFYSYLNMVGIKPNPGIYINELHTEFDVADTLVFGDFSGSLISEELWKLRELTNKIIETGNVRQNHKKDVTDFVMLDYIYQYMDDRRDIETYIIFTGDGHFQSVVNRLVQRKKKRVIIYGIKDSVSKQLQASASEVRFLPTDEELSLSLYKMIASNMDYVQGKMRIIPTFNGTVDAVVTHNNVDRQATRNALSEMLDMGYLYQEECRINFRTVKVIKANWDKLDKEGIWKMDATRSNN